MIFFTFWNVQVEGVVHQTEYLDISNVKLLYSFISSSTVEAFCLHQIYSFAELYRLKHPGELYHRVFIDSLTSFKDCKEVI
jgi:hypothetical protein